MALPRSVIPCVPPLPSLSGILYARQSSRAVVIRTLACLLKYPTRAVIKREPKIYRSGFNPSLKGSYKQTTKEFM